MPAHLILVHGEANNMSRLRSALKTKFAADKKAGRPEMKAAHDRYETQLKTILTPAQFTKMSQMKAEHHGHGRDKMKAKS